MYMLRKLLLNIGDLPAQTSHILFNYLVKQQMKLIYFHVYMIFVFS